MATRKQAREAIIQILYAKELGNDKAIEQAEAFLNAQKIRNKQQEFALTLLHGICNEEKRIADIINVFLKTWDISRLGVIEKNIIKLGVYELLQTNTQKAVIINEAIELTKSFNVQDAFRLVNGILDSVAKTDPKTLDDLIQKQEQIHTEKLTQDSMQQTHIESKKTTKGTQRLKTDSIKKQKFQKPIQREIKQDSTQIPAKKTDMTHIKSVQISVRKKDTEQQNLEQKPKDFNHSKMPKKSSQSKEPKGDRTKSIKQDSKLKKDSKVVQNTRQKKETKQTQDSKNTKNSKDTMKPKRNLNKQTKTTTKKD